MLLKDKVCLVVGASSLRGIGYATVEAFSLHGAKVIAADVAMDDYVAREMADAIEAQIGRTPELLGLRCDLQSLEDCEEVVAASINRFETIDCLANSVGIVRSRGFLDIPEAEFDLLHNVNLKGTFNMCKSVLKPFRERQRGSIINIASVAAQRGGGLVGGAHYAASKGGVISLTKSIAREFGPEGIRANVICPSMTETGMLDGNVTEEQFRDITSAIPLRRAGKASDIAGACVFLASDLAAYVTGATLDVNGGSHIH